MLEQEEDDEFYSYQKNPSKLKYYVILYIVTGVYFFVFFRDTEFTANAAITYMSWIFMGTVIFWSQETYWRHKTPKMIANGDFTTWAGHIEPCGDYGVIKRDGIDSMGVKYSGGGSAGAVIAPLACMNALGPCLAITAHLVPSTYEELPPEVQGYVRYANIKEPYLFGMVAPEQYRETLDDTTGLPAELFGRGLEKPSIGHLDRTIRDLHKALTTKSQLLDSKLRDLGMIVDQAAQMGERSKASRFSDWAFREKDKDKI